MSRARTVADYAAAIRWFFDMAHKHTAHLRFFFELGQLRENPRSGWSIIGIAEKESVAAHTARTALIAYVLAHLEGASSPEHVGMMALVHDVTECRSGDLHKIAQRYVSIDEDAIARDQFLPLGTAGEAMQDLWTEYHQRETQESRIVKDADLLEVALTAKEYVARGYADADDWYRNAGKGLTTEAAKALWRTLGTEPPASWWRGLKRLEP